VQHNAGGVHNAARLWRDQSQRKCLGTLLDLAAKLLCPLGDCGVFQLVARFGDRIAGSDACRPVWNFFSVFN
jgi:hypothetical protein